MVGSVIPRTVRNSLAPANREVGLRLVNDKFATRLRLVVDLCDVGEGVP